MECPVCLDVIAEGASHRTTCGHVFHETCMTWWLRRATTCPLCRTTVSEAPTAPDRSTARLARFASLATELAAIRARLAVMAAAQEAAAAAALTAKRLKSAQRSAWARAAAKHRMQVVLSQMPPHAVAEMEEQRKAKRSAAAKRGAATRAANRMALVTCNE